MCIQPVIQSHLTHANAASHSAYPNCSFGYECILCTILYNYVCVCVCLLMGGRICGSAQEPLGAYHSVLYQPAVIINTTSCFPLVKKLAGKNSSLTAGVLLNAFCML